MSSPLEKFVQENKDRFDTEIPDPRIWEQIDQKINPDDGNITPVRSLPFRRWMAAAACLLLLGTTVFYYFMHQEIKPEMAVNAKTDRPDTGGHLPVVVQPVDSTARILSKDQSVSPATKPDIAGVSGKEPEQGESKEMYYYAKLIEIKHEELKTLEKDEPLLYRQFAGDVQKLDSVYHSLKIQLPNNSNREQVIEAMISNLQLQIGLLNRQLKIIKQIKHSKKSAYEKAYQSV